MPPRNDGLGGKRSKARHAFTRPAALIIAFVCLTALAWEAFYLVAMNLFLSTPLFEKLVDGTPDVVDIHYARGWSFFPTRVHAKGLSIRATDAHVEWILRFDDIDFDCSLLALAKMQFKVTRARGSGITFRARMKVLAPEATADGLAYLPPIDSLGPVGFVPSLPPYPGEWDDSKWHLWSVRIDDAIAEHVREVWIEGARFRGDARVAGGFHLKPMRDAAIGPASIDVESGSVELRGHTVAEPLAATARVEIEGFDPRIASGSDILHGVLLSVDAQTAIPDLADLPMTLPDSMHQKGRVEIPRLRISRGQFGGGDVKADIHLRGRGLRVTAEDLDLRGDLDVDATMSSFGLDTQYASDVHVAIDGALNATHGKVHLAAQVGAHADLPDADLAHQTLGGEVRLAAHELTASFGSRAPGADLTVDRIDVHASTPSLDLEHPSIRGMDYGARVGRAELADARTLNAFLPSPAILAIESGRALLSADVRTSGPGRSAGGRVDVSLIDGGLRLHETHLDGDFALAVAARGFDPHAAKVDLEGSHLAMRNVRVTGAATDTSAWSGELVVQAGTLALAPPRLEADLSLEARDASPVLGVLFRDTIPSFVGELARMPGLVVTTHVVVEPESLIVSNLFASGGDLALRGTYVVSRGDRSAAFVVRKGILSAGISLDNEGSHVRLFGLDHWYDEEARRALAPK